MLRSLLISSAAGGLLLQPPFRSTACTVRHATLHMLEGESLANEEEWSPLDQWLQKGGAEARARAVPSWTVESAGHIHSHFFGRGSFEQLGVSAPLCESLAACGYTQPSTSQVASFKVQAKGEDLVLAQPSGSGKTLAYLVPLLQRLAEAEAEHGKTPPGAVRAVILVPTTDLAQQVVRLARQVAGPMPLRVALCTSEFPMATQKSKLGGGVELCVATLGRLQAHLGGGKGTASFAPDHLVSLVVDEADSVFADDALRQRLATLRAMLPAGCATSLVTASLSPAVEEAIGREMPDAKIVAARDLHTTRPKVLATLLDCSVDARDGDASFDSRLSALREAMAARPDWRTLVLCSNPSTVDRIVDALGDAPGDSAAASTSASDRRRPTVRALHPDVAATERAATLAEFSADGDDDSPTARASASMVLVATDRTVRGLDLPRLEHLTLFDFPRDGVEYLRRVGMATRGSAPPARLTMLAVGRQLSFARALLALDEQGKPLDLDPERR